MSISIPSKKELDEARTFPLLPSDDYLLKLAEVTQNLKNVYMAKPKKDGTIPQEEVVTIKFEVISFRDGADLVDENGDSVEKSNIFFDLRPHRMGFMRDGTPAKSRQLVAFITEQDINEEIALEEWEDLIDKEVFAQIVIYKTQTGKSRNKITRFIPVKSQRPTTKKKIKED